MTQLPATLSGTFTADQVALIKRTICKDGSDDELKLFIAQCERTGLDPFSKQIYAIFRWDKSVGRKIMTIQTGVDGFRVIAERNNQYAGQLGPFWCDADGIWRDMWAPEPYRPPFAAKVGVLRHDFKEALWGTARFEAYASRDKDGKLTSFWAKMPDLMIGKVAECLALRRAFPQELSGLYSAEEMKDGQEGSSATLSGQTKGRTSTQAEMASSDQDAETKVSRPNQIGSSGNQNTDVRRGASTILVNLPAEAGSAQRSSVAAERVLGGDELSGTTEVVYPTLEEEVSAKEASTPTELEAPITKGALLAFLETAVSNGYTEDEASEFLQTFEVEENGKLIPVTEANVLKLQNKHLDLALTMKFGEKKQ